MAGDPEANFLQLSPLAAFPVASALPGIVGYFQIDSSGALSTPLLPGPDVDPGTYGISPEQQAERATLEREIRAVLSASTGLRDSGLRRIAEAVAEPRDQSSKLEEDEAAVAEGALERARDDVSVANASPPASVAPVLEIEAAARRSVVQQPIVVSPEALDSLLNVAEREAASGVGALAAAVPPGAAQSAEEPAAAPAERSKRVEQSNVPEPATQRITMFESEVDPVQFTGLPTGHLLMFRNVWRNGERLVQGAVIDTPRFIAEAVARVFAGAALSATTSLQIRYRDAEQIGRAHV